MASRVQAPAGGHPVPKEVAKVVLLPVAAIDIGNRLRSIDRVWAGALGKVMKAEGQNTPIEVCTLPGRNGWTLVAGAHRLTGAQIEGMAEIAAIVVENDAQKRLAREISENLWRQDLAPLDRAAFIAELVTLHKLRSGIDPEKDGRAVSAAVRWQQALRDDAEDANVTMTFAYGWADGIADRLGLSRSAIERDLYLHRRIPAGLIAKLRATNGGEGHDALRNAAQLRALAKLDEDQQAAAVDRLLWQEETSEKRKPMTLVEAIAAGKAKVAAQPDAETKAFSQFFSAFGRMSAGQKKSALSKLADMLPAGYRLTFGEQAATGGFPENHEEEADTAACLVENAFTLLDGLIEDEIVEGERLEELEAVSADLRRVSFSIRGDRFPLIPAEAASVPAPEPVEAAPVPAVAIRASVKPDYIVCLECGEQQKMLKRHLSTKHDLAPTAYLQRWKLPVDYPMIAPNYAEERRELAAKIGLGKPTKAGGRA